MSTRYFSNAMITLLGGLVVVTSLTLASGPASWIGFGIGVGVVVLTLAMQLDSQRTLAQRALDLLMTGAAVTMIVTSLILAAPFVGWVMFALALGFVGLAMTGLTLHEVLGWRSEHGMAELHWLDSHAGHDRAGHDRAGHDRAGHDRLVA